MRICPELHPPELLQCIQRFAKQHSQFEEAYYAAGECMDASDEFVDAAKAELQKAMHLAAAAELKVVSIGNHPHYKRYCEDKISHWVVAAGEWRIDFTARQFHQWFAFPRVWREPSKRRKKTRNARTSCSYRTTY